MRRSELAVKLPLTVVLLYLLNGCAMPTLPTQKASSAEPVDVTSYAMSKSIPLEIQPGAYSLSPDGSFMILTPKRHDPATAYDFYRYDLNTGETRKIVREREFKDGNITIPLHSGGSAAAVEIVDSDTFYANWGTKLVEISIDSGEILSHIHLGRASGGSNMLFNRMTLTEDGSTLYGIGSDLVRIELAEGAVVIDRDMPLGGGRSMGVISPVKAASANSPTEYNRVTVAIAGDSEPICELDPGAQATYIAASPDGQRLASVLWYRETKSTGVKIFSVADCSETNYWSTGENNVTQVAWLPDNSTLATNGYGEIRFWDASTGELRHTLETNEKKPMLSFFTGDGQRFVTLSPWSDKEIRVFDAN